MDQKVAVPSTSPPDDTVWFCVRRKGAAIRDGWVGLLALNDLPRRVGARDGDVVEACAAEDFRTVAADRFSHVFQRRARGLAGMEIEFRGELRRLAPTRMLAANLGFKRALERFLQERNAGMAEFVAGGGLRVFSATQFLLRGGGHSEQIELFRGATLVEPAPDTDENRAADLADGVGRWMLRNLSATGALPYKYWPSRGTESPADNAIRRFLASLALARLAELRGSPELREAGRRNLRFNLERYFRNIGGGRGAIVEPTGAKLGAAALAALAILESPARAEFLHELKLLAAGVESLVDDEHGFRTFFFPPERDGENWNFYSGEALLFGAEAARRGAGVAPALERCAEAFARCRERHRRDRNPAFVPWHTQACASLFQQTGRREYADFALEISDWLLPMQQWDQDDGLPPDLRGRFYDPRRPQFGPPHAASTGAYLEGLADALTLARSVGDSARVAAYERTITRGLRSLRQLQFRDERDTFYIAKRRRVMGALRTEAYDNTVRVDSAAHALAAAVKLLQPESQPAAGRA
ncbi:MAG: hypothetical protein OXF27_09840 [Acidobacteria bacterium]|nr:hypothetical protein [Acidobacteriota bacterium]